jgi:molybdenum cofactor biosynthesis enzyme MoaA
MTQPARKQQFFVELIRPSRYDDDGYVVQWWRSWVPSNSLACLYGLATDSAARRALGDDVEIVVDAYDESNTVVSARRIIRRIRSRGASGVICMVGVQSNQFPRAMDLAREFRRAGLSVVIGGFHVSGCLRMLPQMPGELQEAQALGISLFAGEAEGRMDALLADAYHGRLKAVYNYLDELPDLRGQPTPLLPGETIRRALGRAATFDTSRGCPFQCKFCTIINVQGRKPRSRSADDVERIVRGYHARGISDFFITDDNFARSKDWEPIVDRLIELRQQQGIGIRFVIQVDATAYRIPRFVDKLRRAGCRWVFVGVESVNPENLASADKRHNHIDEYRDMLQAWHRAAIAVQAGYIVGFPADTPESIARDVQSLKTELPLDLVKLACLMPLPGSVDHRDKLAAGEWMDPDLNRYTGEKAVTHHPRMSRQQWEAALWQSWQTFYSYEQIGTLMRRCQADRRSSVGLLTQVVRDVINVRFDGVQPLEGGLFRRKSRTQRRPGLPRENPLLFYPRRMWEFVSTYVPAFWYAWRLVRLRHHIKYREPRPAVPPQPPSPETAAHADMMHPHIASKQSASPATPSPSGRG